MSDRRKALMDLSAYIESTLELIEGTPVGFMLIGVPQGEGKIVHASNLPLELQNDILSAYMKGNVAFSTLNPATDTKH